MLIARTYPRQRDCGIFVFVGSRLQHSNPTPLHPAPVPYPNRVDWSKRLFLRQSWILALDSVDLAQSPFVLHVDTHTHTQALVSECVLVCVFCHKFNMTCIIFRRRGTNKLCPAVGVVVVAPSSIISCVNCGRGCGYDSDCEGVWQIW